MNLRKIANRFLSKDSSPDQVVLDAVDASLASICQEMGLGTPYPSKGDYASILTILGSIRESVIRYRASYITTQVVQLVREGKKIPKWMQDAMKIEIESQSYTGEPEDIKP